MISKPAKIKLRYCEFLVESGLYVTAIILFPFDGSPSLFKLFTVIQNCLNMAPNTFPGFTFHYSTKFIPFTDDYWMFYKACLLFFLCLYSSFSLLLKCLPSWAPLKSCSEDHFLNTMGDLDVWADLATCSRTHGQWVAEWHGAESHCFLKYFSWIRIIYQPHPWTWQRRQTNKAHRRGMADTVS